MEKRIGAALGFLAFTVAAVSGVMAGNPTVVVLKRAIVALFVFYLLGRGLGWLAERVLAEREETLDEELAREAEAAAAKAGILPGTGAPGEEDGPAEPAGAVAKP